MKKILVPLLALSMLTTVALAAEDTVDYGDTSYIYGGVAAETTDDNENGRLDGLIFRGVEESTYYTAGDGFLYFSPATVDEPAQIILDNATIIADYCIQAVTDVDLTLVGDNYLESLSPYYFLFNVLEGYDENGEARAYEDYDFGSLTIDGTGSLSMVMASYTAFNTGSLAIHGGDVSILMEESDGIAMEINGDFTMSGGTLTISGGTSDSVGMLVTASTNDITVAITGGTTVIEHNGYVSIGVVKNNAEVSAYTVVDFADAPDGVFTLGSMFQFCDVLDIHAEAGTVAIPAFDAVMVEHAPQLSVTGLSDYMYCVNEFSTYDFNTETLVNFTATIVGQPAITWPIRNGLVYPYTTANNIDVSYTLTRAQVIALLWNSFGCPEPTTDNPFTDISPEDEYYEAILWAVEQGITTGTTATTFEPEALCTKGHLLTFLYRYVGQPQIDVENIFADVEEDSYLYNAVLWGIVNTMMDVDAETFNADSTVLNDGAVAFLICMF